MDSLSLLCRFFLGMELLKPEVEGTDSLLKTLWHHSDAVMCCSLKVIIQTSVLFLHCLLKLVFYFDCMEDMMFIYCI